MRRFNIVVNDYYFTSSIILEEAKWYVFCLENISNFICDYFPKISLPKIKITVDNEKTNLKEYYGTFGDLFHVFIHIPIIDWCYKKIKINWIHFPYEELKKLYPDSFDFEDDIDDDFEDDIIKNKEKSEKLGEEFMLKYNEFSKFYK